MYRWLVAYWSKLNALDMETLRSLLRRSPAKDDSSLIDLAPTSYKTESKLRTLISEAFDNKEIQDEISKGDFSPDFLTSSLEGKTPEIWEAATEKIENYNQLENSYKDGIAELRKTQSNIRRAESSRQSWAVIATVLLVLGDVIGLVLIVVPFVTTQSIGSKIAIVALGGSLVAIFVWFHYRLVRWLRASKVNNEKRLTEMQQQLDTQGEELKVAEQAADKDVVDKILSELRLTINLYTSSYDTDLTISDAPGLAEVFNAKYAVHTDFRDKVLYKLGNMPGGSIGIAGPRGVGKTTLINSFCGSSSTVK